MVTGGISVDFLLHWSVGFILGTLIVLPFIYSRWIYDYDAHKWIQVRWGPVPQKGSARQLNTTTTEQATKELYPLTSSRFILYHLIVANLCGVLALLPDVDQIWGGNGMDHAIWANIFFFHTSIDTLSAGTVDAVIGYAFIAALMVWLIVVSIAVNAQIDRKCVENTLY